MGHSTFLDEKVSAVEQAMLDIRLICEELLNQNIADLKTLTEGRSILNLKIVITNTQQQSKRRELRVSSHHV